jgi:hypothetical protein
MIQITSAQVLAHFIGDYLLQSHWMATCKTKASIPAIAHALAYTIPFLWLTDASLWQLGAIALSHFIIDRFRLARYVVFAKNFLAPVSAWPEWSDCSNTGYPSKVPDWLSVWLLIIADNTLHVLGNAIILGSL